MAFVLPEKFEHVIASKSDEELAKRGMTRDDFRQWIVKRVKRAIAAAPQAGDPAPNFELEILSPKGERTGEWMRLSALEGMPVALVMGSYT